MNFSLNTFMVSISGLPFVSITKVRVLLSVCKLNNSKKMCEKAAKKDNRMWCYES